jgi:hypothetical protein
MGVRFVSNGNNTIVNTTVTTTTETVVATTPATNLTLDYQQVLLFWYFVFTTGAATTALTVRLRRGTTISGTLLNVATSTPVSASSAYYLSGCYTDIPGIVAEQQWSITIQAAGATGNGTVNDACIALIAL